MKCVKSKDFFYLKILFLSMFVEVYIFYFCFKLEFVYGFEVLLLKIFKKLLLYYDKIVS